MEREPLNILLIAHGYPPESVGGVEQHVEGLAKALLQAGHQVEIYAASNRPGPQGSLCSDDSGPCPITRVIYRHEGLQNLQDIYERSLLDGRLAEFLQGRSFDLAHVHHLTSLSVGCMEVLRAAQIPILLTLHDYWLMCPRGQMWHRQGHACQQVEPQTCSDCLTPTFGALQPSADAVAAIHQQARHTLAAAHRLLAPSKRVAPFFQALFAGQEGASCPESRCPEIHVVENGVDTHALHQLPPPPADGPLRIGYLGSLIPSKGLDVLVAALNQLPRGMATLRIHGNAVPYHGDEGFLTRVFQQLQPHSQTAYLGPYQTQDLPGILAEVDLVVAPALWQEAFGLTIREAMAAGRAVVVSAIGGLQDAIESGREGLLVPPGDSQALAAALTSLAQDRPRLLSMGAEGQKRSRGFAAMAGDLEQHYRQTLAEHRKS